MRIEPHDSIEVQRSGAQVIDDSRKVRRGPSGANPEKSRRLRIMQLFQAVFEQCRVTAVLNDISVVDLFQVPNDFDDTLSLLGCENLEPREQLVIGKCPQLPFRRGFFAALLRRGFIHTNDTIETAELFHPAARSAPPPRRRAPRRAFEFR